MTEPDVSRTPSRSAVASSRFEMPMKRATKGRWRALVEIVGRPHWRSSAVVHHRDAVGHRQGLLLVVGDVDERDADLALDRLQLHLHLLRSFRSSAPSGSSSSSTAGPVHQRARQRHALLLAAGELARRAVLAAAQLHQLERLRHPRVDLAPGPSGAQPERDVVRT